jgi:hypothetical protein
MKRQWVRSLFTQRQSCGKRSSSTTLRSHALFEEIRRLTHVVTNQGGKWQHVPIEEAKHLDADDIATIENYISFFTVASAIQGKSELRETMGIASTIWPLRLEPLNVTDYVAGLQMSKTAATTG